MDTLSQRKTYTFDAFEPLLLRLMLKENLHHKKAIRIKSDHGREFENSNFDNFYNKHGIRHEHYAPKTPQQNGVVEQKKWNFTRNGLLHAQS